MSCRPILRGLGRGVEEPPLGALVLEFVKTGEGVWAESTFVVCARGSDLEARVSAGEMLFGPAAKWTTRYLFANGGQFVFTKTRVGDLRVETVGWSATFSSREGR